MPEELVLENEAFMSSEFWKERKWSVRQKSKQVMNEKYSILAKHISLHIQEMGKKRGINLKKLIPSYSKTSES